MDASGDDLTARPFMMTRRRSGQSVREECCAAMRPFSSCIAGPLHDQATTIPIRSDRDIVAARRTGRALAGQLGFNSTEAVLIATAISELARNIFQYAGHGEIELTRLTRDERDGISLVARDQGPGIMNIALAMQDGFSTSGGLGLGLPGVKRLLDEFAVVSEPGRGTTITGRKWMK